MRRKKQNQISSSFFRFFCPCNNEKIDWRASRTRTYMTRQLRFGAFRLGFWFLLLPSFCFVIKVRLFGKRESHGAAHTLTGLRVCLHTFMHSVSRSHDLQSCWHVTRDRCPLYPLSAGEVSSKGSDVAHFPGEFPQRRRSGRLSFTARVGGWWHSAQITFSPGHIWILPSIFPRNGHSRFGLPCCFSHSLKTPFVCFISLELELNSIFARSRQKNNRSRITRCWLRSLIPRVSLRSG